MRSAVLDKVAQYSLDQIIFPERGQVLLVGRADATRMTAKTQKIYGSPYGLSLARAAAVREYLKSKGVKSIKIDGKPDSEHLPFEGVKPNSREHRRVEIIHIP